MQQSKRYAFHCTLCGDNFDSIKTAHEHYNVSHHPDALAAAAAATAAAAAAAAAAAEAAAAAVDKVDTGDSSPDEGVSPQERLEDVVIKDPVVHACRHCFKSFTRAFCTKRHENICPALSLTTAPSPLQNLQVQVKGLGLSPVHSSKNQNVVVPGKKKVKKELTEIGEIVPLSSPPSSPPVIKRGRGRPPKKQTTSLNVKLPAVSKRLSTPTMSKEMCAAIQLVKYEHSTHDVDSASTTASLSSHSTIKTRSHPKASLIPSVKMEKRSSTLSSGSAKRICKKVCNYKVHIYIYTNIFNTQSKSFT